MSKKVCSAVRNAQEQSLKKNSAQRHPLLTSQPQSIGGIVIGPPSQSGQAFPNNDFSKPQILQKSSLAAPDSSPRRSFAFASDVEQNDQKVGISSAGISTATGISKTMSDTARPEDAAHKMKFTQSGLLYTLHMIREPVVEYQESRGVPRNEEITFLTLVTSLCTQAYTAGITILVMLWNLMPLVDGFVYFIRFLLDKAIDIIQTEDNKERAIKGAILFGEVTIVTFIIFLIVGLIFMPVYVLMARLFGKIFSMIAW